KALASHMPAAWGGTCGGVSALDDLPDLALRDLLAAACAVLELEHAGVFVEFGFVAAAQQLAVGGEDQVFTGTAGEGGEEQQGGDPGLHEVLLGRDSPPVSARRRTWQGGAGCSAVSVR